jgi:hypothetical protein
MAIVRRELILLHKQPQADGRQSVKEVCFDSAGRSYVHGPMRVNDIGAATDAMNARDWTQHIEGAELRSARSFILNGGSPADYIPTDVDLTTMRRLMIAEFMTTSPRDPEGIVCQMATFIASLTVQQIETAAQISTAKATAVRTRALELRDTVCPALLSDDAQMDAV